MRGVFAVLLVLAASPSGPNPCASIRLRLEQFFHERNTIELAENPLCEARERLVSARAVLAGKPVSKSSIVGTIGSHRAAVERGEPGGSGRFWALAIAVEFGSGTRAACIETSTVAWRNLAKFAAKFGAWEPLARGRLVLWDSVQGDDQGLNVMTVLVPLLYTIEGTKLVLDQKATRAEIARFGVLYREISKSADDNFSTLHSVSADAFAAFGAQTKDCLPARR